MTGRLYNRAIELQVETPLVGDYFGTQAQRTTIKDLRVKFAIEKHLGKEPNTATVSVFNLAERTRAEFQRKPLKVKLFAGYEDSPLDRIFLGDLIWGTSRNPDVTWETQMQLGDGQRAYKHARSGRSFRAGTDIKTVLGDVAKSMGLSVPSNVAEAKEFVKSFTTGITVEGPSQKEMSRLVGAAGHDWSVQNGKLQILKAGEANGIEAHRIAVDTGMLGIPELGAPAEAKAKPVLSVRMRLAGKINPGDPIFMESRHISGLYMVQRINHDGDTHGKEWYSTIEATSI